MAISALHGGKKLTSPDPVYCITVWFCVDLDNTEYQTVYVACALKACAHTLFVINEGFNDY